MKFKLSSKTVALTIISTMMLCLLLHGVLFYMSSLPYVEEITLNISNIKNFILDAIEQGKLMLNKYQSRTDYDLVIKDKVIKAEDTNGEFIIGSNSYLYNVTFIGVTIVVHGNSNLLDNVRIHGLGKAKYGLLISGSNNIVHNVEIRDVGTGMILSGSGNIIMNFNITSVGKAPIEESPKLIYISSGDNNIVANGYGCAPYSNWGIYVEGGSGNIIYNVTITSAHNYFKYSNVKSLFIMKPKAIREPGMYGDDYFEGGPSAGGSVYIIDPIAIGSGTDAIIAGGSGSIFVINPVFYNNQGLLSFTSDNITMFIINGSLSLVETKTWYRSTIPEGVKLVLINSRITPLDFKGRSVESLPYPLWLNLLSSSVIIYKELIFFVAIVLFIPKIILKHILVKTIKSG